MYKKGDLIYYKFRSFEILLEILDKLEDTRYKIMAYACNGTLMDEKYLKKELVFSTKMGRWTKVRAQDLALYTHWSYKVSKFWELLEGSSNV